MSRPGPWAEARAVRGLLAIVTAAIALAACTPGPGAQPQRPANSPQAAGARTPGPAGDCPAVTAPGPEATHAAIDYVDLVHWEGREYVGTAAFDSWGIAAAVTEDRLGPVLFTVRCSFTRLNDLTLSEPPERPGDRDATHLAAGTPVHAVRGWPSSCRLAARSSRDPARIGVYAAVTAFPAALAPLPCAPQSTAPASS